MGIAFASSGTTAMTLVYLFYHLFLPENRLMQLNLREKLRSSVQTMEELNHLPYLNAVIQETFRLLSTIILTLRRLLNRPLRIENGIVLLTGTVVGMQN